MSNRGLVRLGLLILVSVLVYGGLDIAGAAPPIQSVTVGNTASNPVPVSQQGTATVSVGNAAVSVTGTVKIDPAGNTVQLPATAHTSGADNPALQPIAATNVVDLPPGKTNDGGTIYTVPMGKELVVTEVSMDAYIPLGQSLDDAPICYYMTGGTVGGYIQYLTKQSGDTDNPASFIGSAQTEFFADPRASSVGILLTVTPHLASFSPATS
jgi:hypothetical protein